MVKGETLCGRSPARRMGNASMEGAQNVFRFPPSWVQFWISSTAQMQLGELRPGRPNSADKRPETVHKEREMDRKTLCEISK